MNKHKIFRGVRNILEGEPDDWLGQESVHRSLGITNIHINLSDHYLLSIPLSIILCNWDAWERSWPLAFAQANSARAFRPVQHAPGTLREQSFRVYQRFHGYISFAKCSRGKLNELENAPSCVLTRAKRAWSVLQEQNPSGVSAFAPSWSGWESQTVAWRIVGPARRVTKLSKKSDPASRVTLIFVSHVNSAPFL